MALFDDEFAVGMGDRRLPLGHVVFDGTFSQPFGAAPELKFASAHPYFHIHNFDISRDRFIDCDRFGGAGFQAGNVYGDR